MKRYFKIAPLVFAVGAACLVDLLLQCARVWYLRLRGADSEDEGGDLEISFHE